MSQLTPTITCWKIRMVKYLLDMLEWGTVPLWRKSGFLKDALKIFRWISSWHHLWRIGNPDQILHMDQSLHMDQIPHMVKSTLILMLMLLFRRENLRVMNMCIILQIIMFISPRRISLLIHAYSNPSPVKQSAFALMPPFSYGWACIMMNSLPPLQVWVVKKKN